MFDHEDDTHNGKKCSPETVVYYEKSSCLTKFFIKSLVRDALLPFIASSTLLVIPLLWSSSFFSSWSIDPDLMRHWKKARDWKKTCVRNFVQSSCPDSLSAFVVTMIDLILLLEEVCVSETVTSLDSWRAQGKDAKVVCVLSLSRCDTLFWWRMKDAVGVAKNMLLFFSWQENKEWWQPSDWCNTWWRSWILFMYVCPSKKDADQEDHLKATLE